MNSLSYITPIYISVSRHFIPLYLFVTSSNLLYWYPALNKYIQIWAIRSEPQIFYMCFRAIISLSKVWPGTDISNSYQLSIATQKHHKLKVQHWFIELRITAPPSATHRDRWRMFFSQLQRIKTIDFAIFFQNGRTGGVVTSPRINSLSSVCCFAPSGDRISYRIQHTSHTSRCFELKCKP